MEWELILCFIGFIVGYLLYSKFQYRAGGVIVVPMIAIYSLKYPLLGIVLIIISAISYFILEYIFNKHLIYGRRLMYLAYIISIGLSILISFIFEESLGTIDWFPVLLCGMIAYNFHREIHSKIDTKYSLVVSSSYLFFMLISGFVLMVFL